MSVILLSAAFLSSERGLSAVYDFLVLVEPLPEPGERELFMIRLTTHQFPLTGAEREILDQARAAGYRQLLIYYSQPDPLREKFVDCSPLANGAAPADFFRGKMTSAGIGAERYELVEVNSPYGLDEPFRSLAPVIAASGVKSITFATRQTEQRWFALMAKRYFRGVRIHSFNRQPYKLARDRDRWWRTHAGLEGVASEYLKLLSVYLR